MSEEVSPLFPPLSSLKSPRSSLIALSLLALPSSLLASEDGLPFDGWQRINTGYCPAAGDRFECEVTVADDQPRSTAALFGTVRELESERTFAFYVRQGGDDSSVVTYGDTARGAFFPRGKKVTLSVDPNGATWVWEGGSGRLELTPGFARDGVTPLMIGDANAARFVGDSVPAGTGAAMTLHRFRIWRGGLELIHDYVPEQDGSRIGLRDRCGSREFLPLDPQTPRVPVTPGWSSGPYTTAEDATNAMWFAYISPRDDVAAVLGTDVLLKDYRKMFGFAVTGGGETWFVEAVLTPTARANLAATATGAARQIPVAAIARLRDASAIAQQPEIATLAVTTNVTVNGCAPGFFYSLYDGWALTNIVADANATNLNVLCGADAKVTFPEVKKPSERAGFFKVGVGVTDNMGK